MIGIKRWFDELFDGYLVEKHMLGFRVLIGKIKYLIWGCKEEEKETLLWCLRAVWIVSGNSTTRKKKKRENLWTVPQEREEDKREQTGNKRKGGKEQKGQHA